MRKPSCDKLQQLDFFLEARLRVRIHLETLSSVLTTTVYNYPETGSQRVEWASCVAVWYNNALVRRLLKGDHAWHISMSWQCRDQSAATQISSDQLEHYTIYCSVFSMSFLHDVLYALYVIRRKKSYAVRNYMFVPSLNICLFLGNAYPQNPCSKELSLVSQVSRLTL